jgi:hypothetical protein
LSSALEEGPSLLFLSFSLSLTHTHTHTHATLSLSVSLSVSLSSNTPLNDIGSPPRFVPAKCARIAVPSTVLLYEGSSLFLSLSLSTLIIKPILLIVLTLSPIHSTSLHIATPDCCSASL